ncbi:MAG: polymerase sigma factor, sigma-70 family [Paenibacillus sp.]|nr:polymerase sigma factor, sigma-70 family [Paenibacillus sp.]
MNSNGYADAKEDYLALLQQEYLEKLVYYALKKTGNKHEAEELAQDIAVQAVISLSNGSEPAERKHRGRLVTAIIDDEQLAEFEDGGPSVEDRLILKENISLLKRELSLLSFYYREITIAYYIRGERVQDIASNLQLPAGTIKRKLYESRKNIREGMQMAREIGQRSFQAENITFTKSGSDGKGGGPWPLIQRKIPKNILIAAYRNPLTLEELCLEMGISMPYMEEEVQLLADGTLLKEVEKGRYETDFIIVDKTMQSDIFHKLAESGERFSPVLLELLDSALERIRAVGFIGCHLDTDELYWTLIPRVIDLLSNQAEQAKQVPNQYTARPHQGRWDIVGYEDCQLPYSTFVGHNGNGSKTAVMWAYKIRMENLWNRAGELFSHEVHILANAIQSGKPPELLGDSEKEVIRDLMERGFVKKGSGPVMPTFPVWTREQLHQWVNILKSECFYDELYTIMEEHYDYIYNKIGQHVPDRLVNQLKYVSGSYLSDFRMTGLRYALKHNRITIPDPLSSSTIAMYMELHGLFADSPDGP